MNSIAKCSLAAVLFATGLQAHAQSLPIIHIETIAIADTSDEAFRIATNSADRQAQEQCTALGYPGEPVDVSVDPQGTAFPIRGGRDWQAEWKADYQCQPEPPESAARVIAEGQGQALSSIPAARSLAQSHALRDARTQCRREFFLTGTPTVYSVMTDVTECPGDRYCYSTYIAEYNCW